MEPFIHEAYKEEYTKDEDFNGMYQPLQGQHEQVDVDNKDDYHIQDQLLYNMGRIYVPKEERVQLTREACTSMVARHFGVGKIVANLQRYVYWPKMEEEVVWFIKGRIVLY